MSKEVKETNSGVKKKGGWEEVSEFGEEVEEAIENTAEKESVESFNEWRPRKEEKEDDIKKKTVEKAEIPKKPAEEKTEGVKDFKKASGEVKKAGKKAAERKVPEKQIKNASEDITRPFYAGILVAFRKIERIIYSKLSLAFNPYYLDTEDLSADMQKKGKEYEMNVQVRDKNSREKLQKDLGN